jgi:hypothetical protein
MDLAKLAVGAARQGGDVRWRTSRSGDRELHVRLRNNGRTVREFLSAIVEDYLSRGM